MVTPTFLRLPEAKREHIEQALLDEFSRVPLPQAQVSNIVQQTGIARGAFYRYFTDIDDAYQYMLNLALRDIHSGISAYERPEQSHIQPQMQSQSTSKPVTQSQEQNQHTSCQRNNELQQYYQRTADFIHTTANSRYYRMLFWYYQDNAAQYANQQPNPQIDARNWTIATLTHQTIRDCMLDPDNSSKYLARLEQSLHLLQPLP